MTCITQIISSFITQYYLPFQTWLFLLVAWESNTLQTLIYQGFCVLIHHTKMPPIIFLWVFCGCVGGALNAKRRNLLRLSLSTFSTSWNLVLHKVLNKHFIFFFSEEASHRLQHIRFLLQNVVTKFFILNMFICWHKGRMTIVLIQLYTLYTFLRCSSVKKSHTIRMDTSLHCQLR